MRRSSSLPETQAPSRLWLTAVETGMVMAVGLWVVEETWTEEAGRRAVGVVVRGLLAVVVSRLWVVAEGEPLRVESQSGWTYSTSSRH